MTTDNQDQIQQLTAQLAGVECMAGKWEKEVHRLAAQLAAAREALKGLLAHAGIADAHPEDIDAEDHLVESAARKVLKHPSPAADALLEDKARLEQALKDIFAMMDEGLLVRDVSHDHEPDWVISAAKFTQRIARNYQAIQGRKASTKEGA